MIETLLTLTGMELGGFVLKQVLDLGKPVLESYVQDFFKDSLGSGVARLKAASLRTPMAEAVGCFIQQFVDELRYSQVPEPSIQHYYTDALKRFVRDRAVAQVLGKAFETDCRRIDHNSLEEIWTHQYQQSGYSFPEEFDWAGIAKNYVKAVKGIIRADAELRSLLETDLLKQIADNTAQLSPGFDVGRYRDSLQSSYGYLKLYTLDSTDSMDQIRLWRMFVEQTVREALPPTRYEIPIDLKRKLQEEGQLEADLSVEALEHYRRDYLQQPVRKALEAIAETQQAVILGDPGSGKSTLLQYLALEWVEGKTDTLPLLIELREYALAESKSFLEFLHSGRGADWQFDQQQLHQHLLENPTLVMFDGLDEVFHRPTQAAVVDEIIRFTQQYPLAKILVTSRVIGYNPDRFQHAWFSQFTIQSLDDGEIEEFIERWYDLAMGSDADKVRLKRRLGDAITNSKAIRNLADNPLLLTMMAILNRRQELPRDRADLYDQASRVLLYHWDVDHKRLQLPMDAIGRREKQEMLRLVAYEMQAGEEGLKGNLISAERLTQVLTGYLREQGFEGAREKANGLIKQLRERNFILCYRGADSYGFVHRTFLEYFCALEIVQRFEKQRSLSFEELRDEVFGGHWQDETWHEVLRLICGQIDNKLACELVSFVMKQKINKHRFLLEDQYGIERLSAEGLTNFILAIDCFLETRACTESSIYTELLEMSVLEIKEPEISLSREAALALLSRVSKNYPETLQQLKELTNHTRFDMESSVPEVAISVVAGDHFDKPDVLDWLKRLACNPSRFQWVQKAAFYSIAQFYRGNPDVLLWLKQNANDSEEISNTSHRAIAKYFHSDSNTLSWLKERLDLREFDDEAYSVIEALGEFYSENKEAFDIIKNEFKSNYSDIHKTCCTKYITTITLLNKFSCHTEISDFVQEALQLEIKSFNCKNEWNRQDEPFYPTTLILRIQALMHLIGFAIHHNIFLCEANELLELLQKDKYQTSIFPIQKWLQNQLKRYEGKPATKKN